MKLNFQRPLFQFVLAGRSLSGISCNLLFRDTPPALNSASGKFLILYYYSTFVIVIMALNDKGHLCFLFNL